jgi:hypothetical protein
MNLVLRGNGSVNVGRDFAILNSGPAPCSKVAATCLRLHADGRRCKFGGRSPLSWECRRNHYEFGAPIVTRPRSAAIPAAL